MLPFDRAVSDARSGVTLPTSAVSPLSASSAGAVDMTALDGRFHRTALSGDFSAPSSSPQPSRTLPTVSSSSHAFIEYTGSTGPYAVEPLPTGRARHDREPLEHVPKDQLLNIVQHTNAMVRYPALPRNTPFQLKDFIFYHLYADGFMCTLYGSFARKMQPSPLCKPDWLRWKSRYAFFSVSQQIRIFLTCSMMNSFAVVNNRQSFSAAQALSVTLARFEFFVRRDLFL